MKLNIEIDSREAEEVEIDATAETVVASVGGRRYKLELRPHPAARNYLLLHDGRVFNCRVGGDMLKDDSLSVTVNAREYAVKLNDPKRARLTHSGAGQAGSGQIKAQMPGKVVRVLIEAGAAVNAGDALLIVEAMKMQNEIKSPRDGAVKTLNVAAGDTVNAGDVMVVIE